MVESNKDEILPKWREDFPYESQNEDFISRRDFVRYLTLISGGLAVGNFLFLIPSKDKNIKYEKVRVANVSELQPGTWKTFNYPDESHPVMLVRLENGTFVAFGQKCPHLACPVMYHKTDDKEGECLTCHCHNGRFNAAEGHATQGPPLGLRALTRVNLKIEGDSIFAVGLQEVQMTT